MPELRATPSYIRYLPPDADELLAIVTLGRNADLAQPSDDDSGTAELELRVRTPQVTRLVSVEQVEPTRVELTGVRVEITEQVGGYPLGLWHGGDHRYLLRFGFEPQEVGDEIRVARVEIADSSTLAVIAELNLVVEWSDDARLIVAIDSAVAKYTGQTELADAIQAGIDALEDLDPDSATGALNKAARLADAVGDEARRFRLEDLIYKARHSSKTEVSRITSGAGRADADEQQ
jgi:hypothetical protein